MTVTDATGPDYSAGPTGNGRWYKDPMNIIQRRPIWTLVALTAIASLLLYLFPTVDLMVSSLFYGGPDRFEASISPFLRRVRELGKEASRIYAAAAIAGLLVPFLFGGTRFLLRARDALFLALVQIVGPGLIVNILLKGFWGRARPMNVEEFGGDMPFTAPWVIVDHCAWNCSFVSGEGASSIALIALALIAPRSWRPTIVVSVILFTLVMSLNRIAFGGHFFSDVVLSWLITLLVIAVLHKMIYSPQSRITDESVTAVLAASGDRVKTVVGGALGAAGRSTRRFFALFR